jgi:hypothetical protein
LAVGLEHGAAFIGWVEANVNGGVTKSDEGRECPLFMHSCVDVVECGALG